MFQPVRVRHLRTLRSLALAGALVSSFVVAAGPAAAGEANGSTYAFISFDGTDLMGLNNQGRTFSATYGSTTNFKLAVLDKYAPTDPCREAAVGYNSYLAVNDTVGFDGSLTSLANPSVNGIPTDPCHVKVLIDSSNTIKSFQPVP
jgi:hypothetical protein